MRILNFIAFAFFISNYMFAQIEIEDRSQEPALKSNSYSGEFMTFEGVYDNREKAGVVGEKVTLIEVNIGNIFESRRKFKKGNHLDAKKADKIKNKTFEIVSYDYDLTADMLVIKNDDDRFIWKVGVSDKYVFNKFIDVTRNKLEGKTFIPMNFNSEFESLDGTKFRIDGNQKYTVSKVKLAKLDSDYKIVLEINGSFECVYPTGRFEQPTNYNGGVYTRDENSIHISSNDISKRKVTLIEENAFDSFTSVQLEEKEGRRRELEALIGGSGKNSDFLLGNRKLLNDPKPIYTCNESGLVVVRIEVDVNGKVIKAISGVKGSTTTASCLLSAAEKAALQTKWQANRNAPSIQIGTIKYWFSLSH